MKLEDTNQHSEEENSNRREIPEAMKVAGGRRQIPEAVKVAGGLSALMMEEEPKNTAVNQRGSSMSSSSLQGGEQWRHTMDRPPRKKRSVTLVREHSEEYLANLRVQFNRYGCAIGVNRPKFASYRGVTTRKLISILIESWDQVEQCEKDNLWLNIMNYWNIPDDDDPKITKRIKKRQLKSFNTHWKAYKSTLLKLWAAGESLESLEERYPYLDMEMFEKFLTLKSNEEFQVCWNFYLWKKVEKGLRLQKKNKNHPRLGPCGYLGMESQWDEEEEFGLTIKEYCKDLFCCNILFSRIL
ncbi:hypothetical protein LXL04_013695 [Taraxacum kok-saghyz]